MHGSPHVAGQLRGDPVHAHQLTKGSTRRLGHGPPLKPREGRCRADPSRGSSGSRGSTQPQAAGCQNYSVEFCAVEASMRKLKQVTTEIPEEVFVKLQAAKLYARKSAGALIAEGCAIVAEHYRMRRDTEHLTGAPAVLQPVALITGPRRKVTASLPDDLYLSLWAARHFARRPLKILVAEACAHIVEHYWELRRAERTAPRAASGVSQ